MQRNVSRAATALCLSMALFAQGESTALAASPQDALPTSTPIKHVVIIFGENESFDHYFGTYPNATNPAGEPAFTPASGTPTVNGFTPALLSNNPNLNSANGAGAANPFRLDRSQAHTSSQNHAYGPEQSAFDHGNNDLFPEFTGAAGTGGTGVFNTKGLVMGYYDGNTVTALWNYAQHFALSDNSYSSTFGPSTPGAIDLISGQTNGAVGFAPSNGSSTNTINNIVADGQSGFTMFGDSDPHGDVCSSTTAATTEMTGKNIGDLLNAKNITWGWFEGGFNLQAVNPNGSTGCTRSSTSVTVGANRERLCSASPTVPVLPLDAQPQPHPARSRSRRSAPPPKHAAAHHQYDTSDFFAAVQAGNFPSVSFLKAPAVQDAIRATRTRSTNRLSWSTSSTCCSSSPEWNNTAVILAYDDSDGWYDHANNVINPSNSAQDSYTGAQQCAPLPNTAGAMTTPLSGINGLPVQGRCGYGTRQPLLVVSPFAKPNFVDHTLTDQSSIIRFVEDNWLSSQRIGQGSFDGIANPITNMLDFTQKPNATLILNASTGNK